LEHLPGSVEQDRDKQAAQDPEIDPVHDARPDARA
jgi:hypothetical protein